LLNEPTKHVIAQDMLAENYAQLCKN